MSLGLYVDIYMYIFTLSNYRPISLTSVLSKIMGRIKIYKFLTAHSVLHRAQHGFVRRRSVCSNLLGSLNDWTVYVQSRNQTTIIYVDFSKAFDVVSHEIYCSLDSNRTKLAVLSCCGYSTSSVDELIKLRLATRCQTCCFY